MPISAYEQLPDTVLDYKKKHGIGRFDPSASDKHERKVREMWKEVHDEGKSLRITAGPCQRTGAGLFLEQHAN